MGNVPAAPKTPVSAVKSSQRPGDQGSSTSAQNPDDNNDIGWALPPNERGRKILEYYHIPENIKEVGRGHYGVVRKGRRLKDNLVFAVKTIQKRKAVYVDMLRSEISILRQMDHPNVIRVIDVFEDPKQVHIVFELCDGGELFEPIADQNFRFTERQASRLMRKMLLAVNMLHSKNIAHRDLKPENMLLTQPGVEAELKIIDFGLATVVKQGEILHRHVGTPYYIAPEVLEKEYGLACDLWSLGVICYTLMCGYPPFWGDTEKEIYARIRKGYYAFEGPDWAIRSPWALHFIQGLLEMRVSRRMTAIQSLSHPWILFEGPHPDAHPRVVVNHLRAFSTFPLLKQLTLMAVAAPTNSLMSYTSEIEKWMRECVLNIGSDILPLAVMLPNDADGSNSGVGSSKRRSKSVSAISTLDSPVGRARNSSISGHFTKRPRSRSSHYKGKSSSNIANSTASNIISSDLKINKIQKSSPSDKFASGSSGSVSPPGSPTPFPIRSTSKSPSESSRTGSSASMDIDYASHYDGHGRSGSFSRSDSDRDLDSETSVHSSPGSHSSFESKHRVSPRQHRSHSDSSDSSFRRFSFADAIVTAASNSFANASALAYANTVASGAAINSLSAVVAASQSAQKRTLPLSLPLVPLSQTPVVPKILDVTTNAELSSNPPSPVNPSNQSIPSAMNENCIYFADPTFIEHSAVIASNYGMPAMNRRRSVASTGSMKMTAPPQTVVNTIANAAPAISSIGNNINTANQSVANANYSSQRSILSLGMNLNLNMTKEQKEAERKRQNGDIYKRSMKFGVFYTSFAPLSAYAHLASYSPSMVLHNSANIRLPPGYNQIILAENASLTSKPPFKNVGSVNLTKSAMLSVEADPRDPRSVAYSNTSIDDPVSSSRNLISNVSEGRAVVPGKEGIINSAPVYGDNGLLNNKLDDSVLQQVSDHYDARGYNLLLEKPSIFPRIIVNRPEHEKVVSGSLQLDEPLPGAINHISTTFNSPSLECSSQQAVGVYNSTLLSHLSSPAESVSSTSLLTEGCTSNRFINSRSSSKSGQSKDSKHDDLFDPGLFYIPNGPIHPHRSEVLTERFTSLCTYNEGSLPSDYSIDVKSPSWIPLICSNTVALSVLAYDYLIPSLVPASNTSSTDAPLTAALVSSSNMNPPVLTQRFSGLEGMSKSSAPASVVPTSVNGVASDPVVASGEGIAALAGLFGVSRPPSYSTPLQGSLSVFSAFSKLLGIPITQLGPAPVFVPAENTSHPDVHSRLLLSSLRLLSVMLESKVPGADISTALALTRGCDPFREGGVPVPAIRGAVVPWLMPFQGPVLSRVFDLLDADADGHISKKDLKLLFFVCLSLPFPSLALSELVSGAFRISRNAPVVGSVPGCLETLLYSLKPSNIYSERNSNNGVSQSSSNNNNNNSNNSTNSNSKHHNTRNLPNYNPTGPVFPNDNSTLSPNVSLDIPSAMSSYGYIGKKGRFHRISRFFTPSYSSNNVSVKQRLQEAARLARSGDIRANSGPGPNQSSGAFFPKFGSSKSYKKRRSNKDSQKDLDTELDKNRKKDYRDREKMKERDERETAWTRQSTVTVANTMSHYHLGPSSTLPLNSAASHKSSLKSGLGAITVQGLVGGSVVFSTLSNNVPPTAIAGHPIASVANSNTPSVNSAGIASVNPPIGSNVAVSIGMTLNGIAPTNGGLALTSVPPNHLNVVNNINSPTHSTGLIHNYNNPAGYHLTVQKLLGSVGGGVFGGDPLSQHSQAQSSAFLNSNASNPLHVAVTHAANIDKRPLMAGNDLVIFSMEGPSILAGLNASRASHLETQNYWRRMWSFSEKVLYKFYLMSMGSSSNQDGSRTKIGKSIEGKKTKNRHERRKKTKVAPAEFSIESDKSKNATVSNLSGDREVQKPVIDVEFSGVSDPYPPVISVPEEKKIDSVISTPPCSPPFVSKELHFNNITPSFTVAGDVPDAQLSKSTHLSVSGQLVNSAAQNSATIKESPSQVNLSKYVMRSKLAERGRRDRASRLIGHFYGYSDRLKDNSFTDDLSKSISEEERESNLRARLKAHENVSKWMTILERKFPSVTPLEIAEVDARFPDLDLFLDSAIAEADMDGDGLVSLGDFLRLMSGNNDFPL